MAVEGKGGITAKDTVVRLSAITMLSLVIILPRLAPIVKFLLQRLLAKLFNLL